MDICEECLSFDAQPVSDSDFAWEHEEIPRVPGRRGVPIPPSLAKQMQDSQQNTR